MSEKKSMLDGERQYHIQLKEGDIADFVILPGDPGRVDFIAQHFDKYGDDAQKEKFKKLFNYAKKKDIEIFSTPFSLKDVDILEKLNVPFYKVASVDCVNLPLIEKIGFTKKPL